MKPILFSTPMVQAILEERKTMTRRILKPQPEIYEKNGKEMIRHETKKHVIQTELKNAAQQFIGIPCPYGEVGDILWVRETCVKACISEDGEGPISGENWRYWYRADSDWMKHEWDHSGKDGPQDSPSWKPSIFMPKEACRIFLEIIDIKVERLNEISEQDCISEGIKSHLEELTKEPRFKNYMEDASGYGHPDYDYPTTYDPKYSFQTLWQSINGEEGWDKNPWVWAITFKRIDKPENFESNIPVS